MTTYTFNSTNTADYNKFNTDFTKLNFDIDYNKHLIKPDSNKLTKNIPELISYKELADNNKIRIFVA